MSTENLINPDNLDRDNPDEYKKTMKKLQDTVAANIRTLLSQKELKGNVLADLAGISHAAMSEYRNGKRLPSIEFLLFLKLNLNNKILFYYQNDVLPIHSVDIYAKRGKDDRLRPHYFLDNQD